MILKQMSHPVRRVYTDTDCLRWSIDIARALAYLHSGAAGSMILHRDINPDNIMLTSRDPHKSDAKLVDFGLHTSIAQSEDPLDALESSPDGTHAANILTLDIMLSSPDCDMCSTMCPVNSTSGTHKNTACLAGMHCCSPHSAILSATTSLYVVLVLHTETILQPIGT